VLSIFCEFEQLFIYRNILEDDLIMILQKNEKPEGEFIEGPSSIEIKMVC
jgi:hypothetical protein